MKALLDDVVPKPSARCFLSNGRPEFTFWIAFGIPRASSSVRIGYGRLSLVRFVVELFSFILLRAFRSLSTLPVQSGLKNGLAEPSECYVDNLSALLGYQRCRSVFRSHYSRFMITLEMKRKENCDRNLISGNQKAYSEKPRSYSIPLERQCQASNSLHFRMRCLLFSSFSEFLKNCGCLSVI